MIQFNKHFFVSTIVILAALSRLLPHPYNFSPVVALALFSGAMFGKNKYAFTFPLLAYLVSDVLVMALLYGQMNYVDYFFNQNGFVMYIALALVVVSGKFVQPNKVVQVFGGSLIASFLFFLITNAACWPGNAMYSQNISGLFESLVAGIPFYRTAVIGDLFYSGLFFGIAAFLKTQNWFSPKTA
jgi:hypothetical protein